MNPPGCNSRLLYREVPCNVIPEDKPKMPQASRILQPLQILVQHGISPGQLLCLFYEPAQKAYSQICEELQNDHGWQSLCEAIQTLDIYTLNSFSESQSPSSGHPGSFQQSLDPRWSTLTGSTLGDSRVMLESSSRALNLQSTLEQNPYYPPAQSYASAKLDPPFATRLPISQISDTLGFDFEFVLKSDDPIIPSGEDGANFNPQDNTNLSGGFIAAIENDSKPQRSANLHTGFQYSHSPITTPSQETTPSSSTIGHQRSFTRVSALTPVVPDKKFIDYKPPVPPKSCYKSPCPHCPKDFISQKEFVAHMTAEHDRPTQYLCLHPVQGKNKYCFETYRLSRFSRHHNEKHEKSCNMAHEDPRRAPPCRGERPNHHPKQVWGCWLCKHASYSVSAWVKHHMERHENCTRKQMRWTWLIQSLLSQDGTDLPWQNQNDHLEQSTGYRWKIEWSEADEEPSRDRLILNLETKSFEDRPFASDISACQSIVMAAMDATFGFKSMLEPIPADHGRSKRPSTSSPPDYDQVRSSRPHPLQRHKSFAGSKCHLVNVSKMVIQPMSHPT